MRAILIALGIVCLVLIVSAGLAWTLNRNDHNEGQKSHLNATKDEIDVYGLIEGILEMDSETFEDTLDCDFYESDCSALFVSFFNGNMKNSNLTHPFLEVAFRSRGWRSIVQSAVIDCGKSINKDICESHGFASHQRPIFKYFPRKDGSGSKGVHIPYTDDENKLIRSLVTEIQNDYRIHKYADWPNLLPVTNKYTTLRDIWDKAFEAEDEILLIHVETADDPYGIHFMIYFHYLAPEQLTRIITKDHLFERMAKHEQEYPFIGLLKMNAYLDCQNPEKTHQDSEYAQALDILGLEYEKGDHEVAVHTESTIALYDCRNYTSKSGSRYERSIEMARLVPNVPDPNKKAIISSEYLAKNSHFRGNVDPETLKKLIHRRH